MWAQVLVILLIQAFPSREMPYDTKLVLPTPLSNLIMDQSMHFVMISNLLGLSAPQGRTCEVK